MGLKLFSGDLESFRCQASGTSGDWRTRSDDVVGDVVFDRRVRRAHLCERREMRQEVEVGVTWFLWGDGRAR